MLKIDQVTSDAAQKQKIVLPDGTAFTFTIRFIPMQYGWFITNLTYGDFILNGLRITVSPNMLHQFKNQIPFGLACFSKQLREPSLQQDFSSGNASLFVLTSDEVIELARRITSG